MTIKGACLGLALIAGTSFATTAAPLPVAAGFSAQPIAVQTVRYYNRHWHRNFHRGPWWVQDFWGHWRYVGPYTNRSNTHQF
jgi:hypothetical protein